jgi:sulfite exporter TauE/SafE
MLLFGVGTIPLMTTAVYFGSMLKGNMKKSVQQLIPVFVIIIGLLFILRGMGLGIPYISPEPVMDVVDSTLECH